MAVTAMGEAVSESVSGRTMAATGYRVITAATDPIMAWGTIVPGTTTRPTLITTPRGSGGTEVIFMSSRDITICIVAVIGTTDATVATPRL